MGKLVILFMLIASIAFAEISYVTVEEVKDHKKISEKLNQIIAQVNADMSKKTSVKESSIIAYDLSKVKANVTSVEATANSASKNISNLSANLSKVRATVGDPTGTVTDVRDKFIKLMDTIDASSQHTKVTP